MVFADRVDAGAQLAARLSPSGTGRRRPGPARGGVPVAAEVAKRLDLPLDVIVVRKLGVPFQPELAMGAIGEDGARFLNRALIERGRISTSDTVVERRERETLNARVSHLRRGQPRIDLRDKVAIVVDDGVATGATARVACRVARHLGAARVVLAVPVVAAQAARERRRDPGGRGRLRLGAPVLPRRGRPLPGLHPDDRRRGRQPAQTGP